MKPAYKTVRKYSSMTPKQTIFIGMNEQKHFNLKSLERVGKIYEYHRIYTGKNPVLLSLNGTEE